MEEEIKRNCPELTDEQVARIIAGLSGSLIERMLEDFQQSKDIEPSLHSKIPLKNCSASHCGKCFKHNKSKVMPELHYSADRNCYSVRCPQCNSQQRFHGAISTAIRDWNIDQGEYGSGRFR
jgi:hypothetical protein